MDCSSPGGVTVPLHLPSSSFCACADRAQSSGSAAESTSAEIFMRIPCSRCEVRIPTAIMARRFLVVIGPWGKRRPSVHDPPAHHGQQYFGILELLGRYGKKIAIDDDEIGQHTCLQHTFAGLFALGP